MLHILQCSAAQQVMTVRLWLGCRVGSRPAVVRLGYESSDWERLAAEVVALQALQPLQGVSVPRLLKYGFTHEDYAYVATELIEVGLTRLTLRHDESSASCTSYTPAATSKVHSH